MRKLLDVRISEKENMDQSHSRKKYINLIKVKGLPPTADTVFDRH
jgi:hypothetical protein